jgi:hypothetical protein
MMRRRVWLALGSTVAGLIAVGTVSSTALAGTASLVNEPFTGSTTAMPVWSLPAASVSETNSACLTGSSNTSQTPIPGCAASLTAASTPGLQLTTNALQQEGGIAYTSSVPSSLGLDVTFNSYQYTGTGADGIVFYLAASDPTNASASPVTLGPPGGYLGYSANAAGSVAGLTRGYLGVGLDVYGNYTNPAFAGSGCSDPTSGQTPESVSVRGPGNGTAGYCLLSSAQTTTQPVSGTLDSSTSQAVPVEVAVNPTSSTQTAAGGFSVPADSYVVQVTPIGAPAFTESGALPSAAAYVPDPSWVDSNGVPLQLSFGWSATTGASTDVHTISNVNVQTLNGTPPALAVQLTDNSGGSARSGQTVSYYAAASVSAANETRSINLADTFPAGLIPQAGGVTGAGWACTVNGQTVTCTHPAAAIGALPTVTMPVLVSIPAGTPPTALADQVTVGAPDATQGTWTDTETYSPAPTATVLAFVGQPVDDQVNKPMTNADNTTTHITVAADVTSGGAVDPTYNGTVTLAFANNPGNAAFLVGGTPTPTLTATAVNGVADFSPIVINAVGFGDTLAATATGLTAATSSPFDVNAAATSCPSGQTCTVTTTSQSTGQSASVQAQSGTGNAIITATYGGNVSPIHPCTGAVAGILTFSGNRQKVITLTIQLKNLSLLFCYGQPTPFTDITLRPTTYFNPINQEYEGLLPLCLPKLTGPCVKSISLSRTAETVVILSGSADPRIMT